MGKYYNQVFVIFNTVHKLFTPVCAQRGSTWTHLASCSLPLYTPKATINHRNDCDDFPETVIMEFSNEIWLLRIECPL